MRRVTACFLTLLLSACGSNGAAIRGTEAANLYKGGEITLAGPIPAEEAVTAPAVLGFSPQTVHNGNWLFIDRTKKRARLMDGQAVIEELAATGADRLPKGTFQLLHKQRSPLWYAPDAYFVARGLPVPPDGDGARYRRGALGEFAIFIEPATPLHSGPVWTEEIGGVLLDEHEMSNMYYLLPVGASVVVE